MTDFATLILASDSTGLTKGEAALESIAVAAIKTEATVTKATRGMSTGATSVAVAVKAASTSEVVSLAAVAREAQTSAKSVTTALGAVERQAITTAVAVNRSAGVMAGGARQLGMQLSQVGQQTMASGNFIQALAIQLPDIGLAFGTVGIAVGLLAGIALPLLGKAFGSGASAADQMAEANSRLGDSISALRAIGDTSLESLRERYGKVDDALLKLLGHQRDLQLTQAQDAAREAVKALANEYGVATGVLNLFRITGKGAAADIAKDLGLSKDAMLGFQAAIREANAATTFEAQAAALAKIDAYLQRSTISGGEMAMEVNSAALALREVEAAAAAGLANQNAMPGALGAASAAAGGLGTNLQNIGAWAREARNEMATMVAHANDLQSPLERAYATLVNMVNTDAGAGFLSNAIAKAQTLGKVAWNAAMGVLKASGGGEVLSGIAGPSLRGPAGQGDASTAYSSAHEAALATERLAAAAYAARDGFQATASAATGVAGAAAKIAPAIVTAEKAAESFAQTLQNQVKGAVDASVDWIVKGFEGGFKVLLEGWKDTLLQMVAQAAKAKLSKVLFGTGAVAQTATSVAQAAVPGLLNPVNAAGASTGFMGALTASLSNGFSGIFNITANIAAAGSSLLATLGAIAAPLAIVGLLFAAFRKTTTLLATGMNIAIANGEVLANTFRTVQTSSFFGLFKRTTTTSSPITGEQGTALNDAYDQIGRSVSDAAKALGIGAAAFDNFAYNMTVSLIGLSAEDAARAVQDAFGDVANAMAEVALAGAAVPATAEGAAQYLLEIATSLTAVNTASRLLGFDLLGLSVASGVAAAGIVKIYGSLDAFSQATGFYFQNFYSLSEQTAALTADLQSRLLDIGVAAVPKTAEEFRSLVDAAQAAGDTELVAKLISLADEFINLRDVAGQATDAVQGVTGALFGFTDKEAYRTLFDYQKAQALGQNAYADSGPLPDPFIGPAAAQNAAMWQAQTVLLMDIKKLSSFWADTFGKWDTVGMPPVRI